MKKRTTWMMVFTLLSFSVSAQMSTFNLSDYKLPQLERRTLEAGFNLNGYNGLYSSRFFPEEITNNSFNTNGSLRYTYFLNSEQWQRRQDISGNLAYDFHNGKMEGDLRNKSDRFQGDFSALHANRFYFDASRFAEFNLQANYFAGRNFSYTAQDDVFSAREHLMLEHELRITPSFKVGLGRIEPVQDARHAVYILQELAEIARVSPDKSTEEVLEFARLISELKNERFFDSRLKRIYELQMLDSFLLAQNYLLEYDAAYFATLADYWAYGDTPQRLSGHRVSLAFVPEYIYMRSEYTITLPNDYQDIRKANILGLNGGIEYVREKPINLTWQNSIDAALYFGWTQQKDVYEHEVSSHNSESQYRQPTLQAGFAQRIGYYPSTRTSVVAGYDVHYVRFIDATNESKQIQSLEGNGFRVGSNFAMNYYISPQLRLNVSLQLNYLWQDFDGAVGVNYYFRPGQEDYFLNLYAFDPNTERRTHHRFSAGLIYSIF